MSRYSGKYYKGAARDVRVEKQVEALERQEAYDALHPKV